MTNFRSEASSLFKKRFGAEAEEFSFFSSTDSSKLFARIKRGDQSAFCLYFKSKNEGNVFYYLTGVLKNSSVSVPEIYMKDRTGQIFLCEDAGEESLLSLSKKTDSHHLNDKTMSLYKKALEFLALMQTEVDKKIDYKMCRPINKFSRHSVLWDLYYFKYCFLKLFDITFDEPSLEKEFSLMASLVNKIPQRAFVHRDFQSRNIIFKNENIYVIDFTGGRNGPLLYDAASLIFQTRAGLKKSERKQLFDFYSHTDRIKTFSYNPCFLENFFLCALLRILQNLGAYGLRGYHGQNVSFKNCVGEAVANALEIIREIHIAFFPAVEESLNESLEKIAGLTPSLEKGKLTVRIKSFSYKKGIPRDLGVHGGGFVFDCRHLINPGREAGFASLTGKDVEVALFLDKDPGVLYFIDNVKKTIVAALENYIERNFEQLDVYFGCTGGKHRSVYCAEKLKDFLKGNKKVFVQISHLETEFK